jgi:hypothetical protein
VSETAPPARRGCLLSGTHAMALTRGSVEGRRLIQALADVSMAERRLAIPCWYEIRTPPGRCDLRHIHHAPDRKLSELAEIYLRV